MVESIIQIKKWNDNTCRCEYKKTSYMWKRFIWNPAACSCKNGKYLASITEDSVITCDEMIEETKTIATNFNERNIICETKNFYVLLIFLLITIALLIAINIYHCLIRYQTKHKHSLRYYVTNHKLKEILY